MGNKNIDNSFILPVCLKRKHSVNFVCSLPPENGRCELPASKSAAQMAGKQVINLLCKLVTYFRPDSLSEFFLLL